MEEYKEDNFKCKLCKNAYRYEGTLKTHIMVKHCKTNSYYCDQCEYHQSSVDVDLKISDDPASKPDSGRGPDEGQIICNQSEFCPIKTNFWEEDKPLLAGVNNETIKVDGKNYIYNDRTTLKCKQCEYTSSDVGNLKEHSKIHRREKPNKCNQCDYASSRAGSLGRHLNTHNGEKSN